MKFQFYIESGNIREMCLNKSENMLEINLMSLPNLRIFLSLILCLLNAVGTLPIITIEKDLGHSLFIDSFSLEKITCSFSILPFFKVTASKELFLCSCGRIHYLVWSDSIS